MRSIHRSKLPVIEAGCSRRVLLQALGVGAVGAIVLGGCQQGSSLPGATSTMCGANVCIDLGDAKNAELTMTNGAMAVHIAGDTVAVIRKSETEIVALSAVCTHSGCEMDYNASTEQLDCNCHGSVFRLDGSVVAGPARRPVAVYQATLAGSTITIVP